MNDKIVFVATLPDSRGAAPAYLDELSNHYAVLHPSYAYETEQGKKILQKLPDPKPPSSDNFWQGVLLKDIWGVEQSDLLVFDIDSNMDAHFLSVAVIHNKPIIAVSESLKGAPAYFSGSIFGTVKPEDLISFIDYFFKLKPLFKSTKGRPVGGKIKKEAEKEETENKAEKE